MNKNQRHQAIQTIIEKEGGSTQEVIRSLLQDMGIEASQSTLSRDLRELGAIKTHTGGQSVYRLPAIVLNGALGNGIGQAVSEFVIGCEPIGNFLVIKTQPGNARDFCLVLDRQNWPKLIGTLAGDDTILCILKNAQDVADIQARLGH